MEAFLRALLKLIAQTDPGFAGRHPASLPPLDEVELSSVDYVVESVPMSLRALRPVPWPDMEGYADGSAPTVPDWRRLAEQALRVNALDDAIAFADGAITAEHASGERMGQLRLVQAIAGRWLGRFADAERWAREAVELLPRDSTGWCSAIGHLALACGSMGKNDELPGLARQLLAVEAKAAPSGAHVIGLNRLIVQLVRAGNVEMAQRLALAVGALAGRQGDVDAIVQAWIDVGKAALALHAGDLTTYLEMLESALVGFADAGDPRNTCLQRSYIGYAYRELGVYDRAEGILRNALVVGEPMKLHINSTVQVNLGFTLARLGRLDEALEVETAAHALCVRLGNRRSDTFSRIYLAEIHRLRGDLANAEEEARRAVAMATTPGTRAYGLATLGHMLLARDPREALTAARDAMGTLQSLEGIEEGEPLIRLVHVLALEATGDRARAIDHAREAHQRLIERASRIVDPGLRRSFLERVPENARIRALQRSP
jgi:eukaryotic-like serine/threonine-protein kinase